MPISLIFIYIFFGYFIADAVNYFFWRLPGPHQRLKKGFDLFPYVQVHLFKREIHVHHWMYLSALLAVTFFDTQPYLRPLRWILLGAILQGLSYKDRFNVIVK